MNKDRRHPIGLWCLSLMYMFYVFAFGGIWTLLTLFLVNYVNLPSNRAYEIYSAFSSLVWTFPLIGGYLATQFGYKRITIVGTLICIVGIFLMSVANIYVVYLALGIIIVGYGMSTPACFVMVGLLYDKDDKRRESGYTTFYMLFNIGFLLAALMGGYLTNYFGYLYTFQILAFLMSVSLFLFISSLRWIKINPGKMTFSHHSRFSIVAVPIFIAIFSSPIIALLLKFNRLNNLLLFTLLFISVGFILRVIFREKNFLERKRLYALLALFFISIGFWALYMLEPSLLVVFINYNVDRNIFGLNIPAASYSSLSAFFIVVLGYGLSRLWWLLSLKGKDFSIPTKVVFSLISMGIGYWLLVVGIYFANQQFLTSSIWVVFCYVFLATAELLIAPISMSMIGRLSPEGKEGVLMGAWQIFIGFSGVLAGYLAQLAVIPKHSTIIETNPIYSHVFLEIGSATILLGLISAFFIATLKKYIDGKNLSSTEPSKRTIAF